MAFKSVEGMPDAARNVEQALTIYSVTICDTNMDGVGRLFLARFGHFEPPRFWLGKP
jgi:hypothetical protein